MKTRSSVQRSARIASPSVNPIKPPLSILYAISPRARFSQTLTPALSPRGEGAAPSPPRGEGGDEGEF